jgi:hypothetical protein
VADELAGLAQGGRRDPDRREEIAAEQERQTLRADAIILEARAAAMALVCLGCERIG